MDWIKLTDRMPNLDEHDRTLIYTEGSDFNARETHQSRGQPMHFGC